MQSGTSRIFGLKSVRYYLGYVILSCEYLWRNESSMWGPASGADLATTVQIAVRAK
jgi:hypothetical protein